MELKKCQTHAGRRRPSVLYTFRCSFRPSLYPDWSCLSAFLPTEMTSVTMNFVCHHVSLWPGELKFRVCCCGQLPGYFSFTTYNRWVVTDSTDSFIPSVQDNNYGFISMGSYCYRLEWGRNAVLQDTPRPPRSIFDQWPSRVLLRIAQAYILVLWLFGYLVISLRWNLGLVASMHFPTASHGNANRNPSYVHLIVILCREFSN